MGELHIVLLVKPPLLLFPLGGLSALALGCVWVFVKLDVVAKDTDDFLNVGLVTPPSVSSVDQSGLSCETGVTG